VKLRGKLACAGAVDDDTIMPRWRVPGDGARRTTGAEHDRAAARSCRARARRMARTCVGVADKSPAVEP
jgi:hypothetical protein